MWKEYSSYFQSFAPQLSEEWFQQRYCSLTAGNSGSWTGISKFADTPDNEADYICNLKKKDFSEMQKFNMKNGIEGEDFVRQWYSQQLNIKIEEVGLSVWKENPIFRGSLDGNPIGYEDGDESFFIEIKITQDDVYYPLLKHLEAIRKGFRPDKYYHNHIYDSHYTQMTINGVIHGRKYCHYIVKGSKTNRVYVEKIPINYEYWKNVLYPQGLKFYEEYIVPRMEKHGLKRIDPK